MEESIVDTFIEIHPLNSDDFLKVKETLTRIGIASRRSDGKPTLWQSCHVLHKRGRYYIVHFKQMFLLDGRTSRTDFTEDDACRTASVVNLIEQWGLVRRIDKKTSSCNTAVVVIPYADKSKWNLKSKYSMGRKNYERL